MVENSFSRHSQLLFGLAIFVICLLLRAVTFGIPHIDVPMYRVISDQMLQGHDLYAYSWDNKPPGIYVVFALFNWLFGPGPLAPYILSVLGHTLCAIGCAFAVCRFRKGTTLFSTAPIFAALAWLIMSLDSGHASNQVNNELFMNLCRIWAFGLILRPFANESARGRVLRFAYAGSLFVIATFFKQVVILSAIFLALAHLATCSEEDEASVKQRLIDFAIIGIVGALGWALLLGYFALTNRGAIAWQTIVTFGLWFSKSYKAGLTGKLLLLLSWPKLRAIQGTFIFVLVAFIGFMLTSRKALRQWILWLVFFLTAFLETALPGTAAGGHFQLTIPPIVLGPSFLLAILQISSKKRASLLAFTLIIAAILSVAYSNYDQEGDSQFYRQMVARRHRFGKLARKLLQPNESVYNWGWDTDIYPAAQRKAASGVLFSQHTLYGPLAEMMENRLLGHLTKNEPPIIIVNRHLELSGNIANWFNDNYSPMAAAHHDNVFVVLARKNMRRRFDVANIHLEELSLPTLVSDKLAFTYENKGKFVHSLWINFNVAEPEGLPEPMQISISCDKDLNFNQTVGLRPNRPYCFWVAQKVDKIKIKASSLGEVRNIKCHLRLLRED